MNLLDLWLPILVSAGVAWVVSAICWMALPHHAKDYGRLPDEAALQGALRAGSVPPGSYAFPYASRKECRDPEFAKRWREGPTGWIVVMGRMSMGRNMLLTFAVYLVVSVLIGYLASETLAAGAARMRVFRITGTAGILAYGFAQLPNAIWFSHSRPSIVNGVVDGVLLGLATGAAFALLW